MRWLSPTNSARPMAISYTFQAGDVVERSEVELPSTSRPELPSCGVFSFAKAGSVLVNEIVRDMMAAAGVGVIDWPTVLIQAGVDIASFNGSFGEAFPVSGYCFGGFREIPRTFLGAPAIAKLRKILVVRDPRDMLVSRYFWAKSSHGFVEHGTPQFATLMRQLIEDGKRDVDEYCLFYSWIVNADFFLYREIAGT